MRRPLLLRLLPPALRTRAYYHLFRQRGALHAELYAAAALDHAPGVTMRLVPGDEGHGCIAYTGAYELELTRHMVRAARAGGTLVDVGANYGYFSLLWAAQRPANRVVAFEASPRNAADLQHNIASNGLGGRIELQQLALGKTQGRMAFDVGPSAQSGWGGLTDAASDRTIEVDVVRLDDFWQREDQIAVLKIDVEGADSWVLRGARRLLRERRIGIVFYEENLPRMQALGIVPGDAERTLDDLGYRVRALTNRRRELVEYVACPDK